VGADRFGGAQRGNSLDGPRPADQIGDARVAAPDQRP